ncbi:hypothetical protein CH263_13400 [Rhodococcus sp. 06-1059B-a]|nr:hypothetical protein [Rhodococcus sp. 06-1059B-a]OZD65134.1 hypothetical protein CH263_13400 [Rhodococcus sp. 06-1059B-a]
MSNPEQSVIDSIDALIDEQLDAGEPYGGHDFGDPDYPRCHRCHNQWHGLPEYGCPGSGTEGPETPPCPHCGRQWHTEAGGYYALCPGSTFIGPRRPGPFEEERDADGYLPNVPRETQFPRPQRSPLLEALLRMQLMPLWNLPDDTFDISQYGPEPTRAPRPRESIFGGLMNYMESLHGRPYDWGDGQYGARGTFTEIDEHRETYERMSKILTWTNPFLPNAYARREPRPWLYVPRRRVIPAYTYESGATVRIWDAAWNCTGEVRQLRITGTRPELVDATMPTLEPIPRWATDPEQLRWALTHPTIPDGRPYAHGRDFHIGVGTRVGWDNGNGNVWIGTVTETPRQTSHGWQITLGGHTPAHAEPPVGESVTALADAWHRQTIAEQQPPMWTVKPGRTRRRNTRRRHR